MTERWHSVQFITQNHLPTPSHPRVAYHFATWNFYFQRCAHLTAIASLPLKYCLLILHFCLTWTAHTSAAWWWDSSTWAPCPLTLPPTTPLRASHITSTFTTTTPGAPCHSWALLKNVFLPQVFHWIPEAIVNSSKIFSDPRKRMYANKTPVMLSEGCILEAAEENQRITAEVPKRTNRRA